MRKKKAVSRPPQSEITWIKSSIENLNQEYSDLFESTCEHVRGRNVKGEPEGQYDATHLWGFMTSNSHGGKKFLDVLDNRKRAPTKSTASQLGSLGIGSRSLQVLIYISAKAQGFASKKDENVCDLNQWLSSYAQYTDDIDEELPSIFIKYKDEYELLSGKTEGKKPTQTEESDKATRKKTEHFTTTRSDEHWLSPLNDTFIPFVGRETEMAQLDAFVNGDPDKEKGFQLWAIVAPSGAGKTRLLVHWANNDVQGVLNGWKVINIKSAANNKSWNTWLPEQPSLLCIDYIYGYDKVISDIISRAESLKFNFPYPVRLLLLDHATPDNMSDLLKDPRWGLEGKSPEGFAPLEDKVFFKNAPLKLEVSDKDDRFLSQIICAVAYKEINNPFNHIGDPDIKSGLEYFNENETNSREAVRQPLFAALVGDAIRTAKQDGGDTEAYKKLSRRALMEQYLQGKNRLGWLRKNKDWGVLVACFVSAATALRGVDFNMLRRALPKKHRKVIDLHYSKFKSECRSVVSGGDKNTLNAFEPDILGETHFLLFLDAVKTDFPDFADHLPMLIAAKNEDYMGKAHEFLAFITRLARNLSNDDQKHSSTKRFWDLIGALLISNKEDNGVSRWVKSSASFEIYLILRAKGLNERPEVFLNRIVSEDLYKPPKKLINARHIWLAIKYFHLKRRRGAFVPTLLMQLLELWDCEEDRDYTALMLAIWVGSPIIIYLLINRGINLNAVSKKEKWTALMFSFHHYQEEVALELVRKSANLEAQNSEGWTALMFACSSYCREEVVLELIRKGVNLEAQNGDGWTALMYACNSHYQEEVALELVRKDANLGAQNNEGWTALMFACDSQYEEKVALELAKKGANLEAQNDEGWTALMYACNSHYQEEVALELVRKDANLGAQNNEGWTALMFACRNYQKSAALELIEKGVNLEAQNNEGSTALMLACRDNLNTAALELVRRSANLGVQNSEGWTALMFSCRHGLEKAALELLRKSANLEAQNSKGWTALMLACSHGQKAIALKLVKRGGNLEAQNSEGSTALMIACCHDLEAVALELVRTGTDLEAQNSEGWTALMFACRYGLETVALALLNKNVGINSKNIKGETILMFAVFSNLKHIVEILLEREANTDDVWIHGKIECTVLGLARGYRQHEIVEMLEAKNALELPLFKSD